MEVSPVQCPRCGHANPEGARFCAQCGTSLEIVCAVCSTPAPRDARFCNNCGSGFGGEPAAPVEDLARYVPEELLSKIRAARAGASMRGERRTVTMLFADMKGSTTAAEGLDPEEWAEIINGAFEHLIAPVYRYEGTLARLQGDAVLAFFGAPIAHEDDPVRAVRAGLEIIGGMAPYKHVVLERWGVPIDVRVGINTGLVVVGEVGSDLRVEYTALGDAINVAARMEQTADPGTVRVTGDTWGLVADHFEGEELGPVEVKGKSASVTAFRVDALRGEPRRSADRSMLVGRSEELETLAGLRQRLFGGTGSIISIIGEAGLGKSKLLDEFRSGAEAEATAFTHDAPGQLAWMEGASRSYDASVPYATISDLLVRWWQLGDASDPFERIRQVVAATTDEDVEDTTAFLGHVTGSAMPEGATALIDRLDPPALHGRVKAAVISHVESEARRRPVVLVLEDLHWADPLSLALIDDLLRLADRAPLGLVLSMRPYRDEPTWHVHETAQREYPHRYRPIELTSLDTDAAERLLDVMLEGARVSDEVGRRILERSDGNPLFIEQMARAIRESGPEADIRVPSGLAPLLTARLDRLGEESRLVAQVGSVIGAEFDRGVLASLVGEGVRFEERVTDLLRRGVLVERHEGTGTLAFHHALMQDAAYSTILLRTRRDLHHRVAEYLVANAPESVQEIARHFVEAGDTDAAFPHLVDAGERSSRAMALSDAIDFFATALDNIPADAAPELVVRAHEGLGTAHSLVPDLTRSAAAYQRLLDYADVAGRPSAKVTALNRLGLNAATLGGDLAGAHRYLDDAFTLASEIDDEIGLAEYHMNACFIASMGGDLETSLVHDAEIARLGEDHGMVAVQVEGLARMALNSVALMDFEQAVPAIDRAIEAATAADDELAVAIVRGVASSRLLLREGRVEEALRVMLDDHETLDRYASFYAPFLQIQAGALLFELGDVEDAISRTADGRRSAIDGGPGLSASAAGAAAQLARFYSALGIVEPLSELRTAALDAVAVPMGDLVASSVWCDLGFTELALGEPESAHESFEHGLAASSTSQFWERPRLLVGRGRAQVALGRFDDAHVSLDEAESFVMAKEVAIFDGGVGHARGMAFLADGRPGDAAARFDAALASAQRLGLRTRLVQISLDAARAALALGKSEDAARHAATARVEAEAMVGSVVDEALRSAVRTTWLAPVEQIVGG